MRSSRGSHEGAWIWGRRSTLRPAWLPGCGENHFVPGVSGLSSAAELGTATRRKPPRRARRGHAGRAQAGRGARAPGRPSAARLPGAPRLAAGVWAPRPLPALRLYCHLPQLFFPRLACCCGQALISFVLFSLKKKNHYMFFKLEENSGIRRLESGKQRRAARETAPRPQADDGHLCDAARTSAAVPPGGKHPAAPSDAGDSSSACGQTADARRPPTRRAARARFPRPVMSPSPGIGPGRRASPGRRRQVAQALLRRGASAAPLDVQPPNVSSHDRSVSERGRMAPGVGQLALDRPAAGIGDHRPMRRGASPRRGRGRVTHGPGRCSPQG